MRFGLTLTFIGIACGFAMAAPGAAETPSASEQAGTPASKASDPNRKICRSEPIIGSLSRSKKTCRTRAEWKEMEAKGGSSFREFQDQNRANSTVGG